MKDYQKLFAVRENNLTAEEIAGAETLVLFLCKGCIPALPKMNAPEYLVKAVDELLKKNENWLIPVKLRILPCLAKRFAAGGYLRLRRRKCLQAQ